MYAELLAFIGYQLIFFIEISRLSTLFCHFGRLKSRTKWIVLRTMYNLQGMRKMPNVFKTWLSGLSFHSSQVFTSFFVSWLTYIIYCNARRLRPGCSITKEWEKHEFDIEMLFHFLLKLLLPADAATLI